MQPVLLQDISKIHGSWVTKALGAADLKVPEISGVSYKPIGQGNSSDVFKLDLSYSEKEAEGPETLVLKIHSSNPDTAKAAADNGVYKCEHRMTRELKGVPGLRTPAYYYSAVSDSGHQANILMEDLTETCVSGDQISGVSASQAMATVKELLKVHTHYWESAALDDFDWIVDIDHKFHRLGAKNIHDRLGGKLSEDEFRIIYKSLKHIDNWLEATPSHRTLIHSDCRADNILFEEGTDGGSKAYIIDWASCKIGDAMADITYLLSSSVAVDQRPGLEREVIECCAEEIAKVQPGYDLEEARDAYRDNITSSMFMTLLAGAFIPQTPHTDLLLGTLARRNCATLKDWLDL